MRLSRKQEIVGSNPIRALKSIHLEAFESFLPLNQFKKSQIVSNVVLIFNQFLFCFQSLAFSLPSESSQQKDLFNSAKGCTKSFMQLLEFLKVEVENGFAGDKASFKSMTEITRNLSKEVTRLQNIGNSLEKEEHNVKAAESLDSTAAQLSREVDKFTKLRPSKPLVAQMTTTGAKAVENKEMEKQIEFSDAVWGSSTDIARAVLTLIRAATEAQAAIDATYKVS